MRKDYGEMVDGIVPDSEVGMKKTEGKLGDLQKRAGSRDMSAKMTPGAKVNKPRFYYFDEAGERVPVYERPRGLGHVALADLVVSGLDEANAGSLSGFGNWMVHEGRDDEIEPEKRRGATTVLPEGNVAEQDLYDRGTPGGGSELGEESFEVLRTSGREIAARRTISQWRRDLDVLTGRFDEVLNESQKHADKGDEARASILLDRAQRLGQQIRNLRNKISAREQYEAESLNYEDMPSSLATLGEFDDLDHRGIR